jgi:hypothetical protein
MNRIISEEDFRKMENAVRGTDSAGRNGRAPNQSLGRPENRQGLTKPSPSPPFAPFMLSLTGQLPSGKNQVQLLWRNGKVQRYPNKTFTNWRSLSHVQILEQGGIPSQPITRPVRLTADYWPSNLIVRDVSGQLDAIFSLLVYSKVLKNDGLIYDVIWRRHEVNTKFPKVVMELEAW